MRAKGVTEAKAKLMYWAVKTFDPKWKIVTRNFQICSETDGKVTCSSRPRTALLQGAAISESDLSSEQKQTIDSYLRKLGAALDASNGTSLPYQSFPYRCEECIVEPTYVTSLDVLDRLSNDFRAVNQILTPLVEESK